MDDGAGTMISNNHSLTEYVTWHVSQASEDTDALLAALKTLNNESCKPSQLKNFTMEMWRSLGIPIGIGMMLADKLGKFEKQRHFNGNY